MNNRPDYSEWGIGEKLEMILENQQAMEADLKLLIDKVNRIEDWIDERTPPPPSDPEGDIYCEMVKRRVEMGRGCSCTTETGCTFRKETPIDL